MMQRTTGISMKQQEQRLAAVNRVHEALNARRDWMPMTQDREVMLFVGGSFAVLCLMGLAAMM